MKHGGDISLAAAAYARSADGWLDLSTGIAPDLYPLPDISAAAWQQLPQQAALDRLLEIARTAYGAPPDAAIAAAPGTQLLIQLLPLLRPGTTVRILGPTYSEHAICWQRTADAVATVTQLRDLADTDVAVVTNPNNPDGRVIAARDLVDLAADLAARGGLLIVDEAFADVAPDVSVATQAGTPGLLILRSFGKFYGLAGLRLGFALGCAGDIDALAGLLGPWAVPGPALEIATAALADTAWADTARQSYRNQADALDEVLTANGFDVLGGTTLFRLARHADAAAMHDRLARAGILTRRFANHPDWLRFGLPGEPANLARLGAALASATTRRDGR